MTYQEAVDYAQKILSENNLKNWKINPLNSSRWLGLCVYTYKEIKINKHAMPFVTDKSVINTITHEIAHAIAGPKHNHDEYWKSIHKKLGGNGEIKAVKSEEYKDGTGVEFSESVTRYKGVCQNGHVHYKKNKPNKKVYSCTVCSPKKFNKNYIVEFKKFK